MEAILAQEGKQWDGFRLTSYYLGGGKVANLQVVGAVEISQPELFPRKQSALGYCDCTGLAPVPAGHYSCRPK